jgi:hypothetical protein
VWATLPVQYSPTRVRPLVRDSTAMTASKLGPVSSSVLASVLATAVGLAPVHVLAAPPEETEVSIGAPEEGEEGAPGDVETPEGETPEGETPPEGEGEVTEGETPEGETPEGEATEGEGEGEVEEPEEEVPPPVVEETGPLRPPEPTWGPKSQYPRNGKGMLITGGLVTGLGAAFIITSVLVTRCDFDSNLSCKFGDQRNFLVPTAVATTGLGLLLIGVGVANHIKYKRWQNWTPEKAAMVPTYVPGGGGVALVGRF